MDITGFCTKSNKEYINNKKLLCIIKFRGVKNKRENISTIITRMFLFLRVFLKNIILIELKVSKI